MRQLGVLHGPGTTSNCLRKGLSRPQPNLTRTPCPQLPASTWRSTAKPNLHAASFITAAKPLWLLRQQHQGRRQASHQPRALSDAVTFVVESPYRDLMCCTASVAGALVLVKFFDILASRSVVDKKLSRKLVHMISGPLFVLSWPLFSADPAARFLAASVPFLNFTRLMLVGQGVIEDRGLVLSVSRSGERGELLKGPLYYCIVLIVVAILCWRDNPSGLMAISLMCGGDGLADIIGRRFGTVKLPYNSAKSWAGSLAMLLGGASMSLGLIYYFCNMGFFACYAPSYMVPYVLTVSLAATIAESLPINQVVDDNISVPLVSLSLSAIAMASLSAAS